MLWISFDWYNLAFDFLLEVGCEEGWVLKIGMIILLCSFNSFIKSENPWNSRDIEIKMKLI